MPGRPAVHLLACTHTTRHLEACVASLAAQRQPPATFTLTCDGADQEIAYTLLEAWRSVQDAFGERVPTLILTQRPHTGEARLNQVRNNALRALDAGAYLSPHDLVVVIDGDMVLWPDAIEQYGALAAEGADVVIPYRVNLDEKRTRLLVRLIARAPAEGARAMASVLTDTDRARLAEREQRYLRQHRLKRIPLVGSLLVKSHKPKLLGGHHAVRARTLRAVNGYDEEYVGYGYDDDDVARRLHASRPRPRVDVAVRRIGAIHLWHPTRAPSRPTDAPGYARFRRSDLPTACAHGWENPIEQPEPLTRVWPSGPGKASAPAG